MVDDKPLASPEVTASKPQSHEVTEMEAAMLRKTDRFVSDVLEASVLVFMHLPHCDVLPVIFRICGAICCSFSFPPLLGFQIIVRYWLQQPIMWEPAQLRAGLWDCIAVELRR